jgi:hypothetical protein
MTPARDKPQRPAYGDAWVGGVLTGLLRGAPAAWLPEPVHGARLVVLLVLDGLGWHALERWPAHVPTLCSLAGGPITTCAPSTTSAALTSIATGLAPAEHGVIGYRMRVGGEILNVLQWETASGEPGPDPASVQPHTPFDGHALRLVTRAEFRGSGFTEAHLRGGTIIGWRTTAILREHVRRLARGEDHVVYAYYDGVDKVAHEYGLESGFFEAELAEADRLVADLLACLPRDAALLVTSDHGQVHVAADDKVGLDAVPPLFAAHSGEGRFRGLHARRGADAELVAACREAYGERAWVFTRDELFDGGWLGAGATALVRGRLGDVVLAARAPVAFIAPDHLREAALSGYHGSLTSDELRVPLLAGRGTAPG